MYREVTGKYEVGTGSNIDYKYSPQSRKGRKGRKVKEQREKKKKKKSIKLNDNLKPEFDQRKGIEGCRKKEKKMSNVRNSRS